MSLGPMGRSLSVIALAAASGLATAEAGSSNDISILDKPFDLSGQMYDERGHFTAPKTDLKFDVGTGLRGLLSGKNLKLGSPEDVMAAAKGKDFEIPMMTPQAPETLSKIGSVLQARKISTVLVGVCVGLEKDAQKPTDYDLGHLEKVKTEITNLLNGVDGYPGLAEEFGVGVHAIVPLVCGDNESEGLNGIAPQINDVILIANDHRPRLMADGSWPSEVEDVGLSLQAVASAGYHLQTFDEFMDPDIGLNHKNNSSNNNEFAHTGISSLTQ